MDGTTSSTLFNRMAMEQESTLGSTVGSSNNRLIARCGDGVVPARFLGQLSSHCMRVLGGKTCHGLWLREA